MSANDELQAHTCEKAMEEYLALLYKNGELELGREYWLKTACTRLPEKGYFTKIEGKFGFYRKPKGFRSNCLLDVEQVLAPVPSYEDWQSLNELLDSMRDTNKALAHKLNNIKVNGNYPDKISKLKSRIKGLLEENEKLKKWCEEFNALDVAKENQQLKELLSKCREKLDELDYGCEVWQGELTGFIEEIDNAIGEKK